MPETLSFPQENEAGRYMHVRFDYPSGITEAKDDVITEDEEFVRHQEWLRQALVRVFGLKNS